MEHPTTTQPVQPPKQTRKTREELRLAHLRDVERLMALMFGDSGDPEQEHRAYLEYFGVDPRTPVK